MIDPLRPNPASQAALTQGWAARLSSAVSNVRVAATPTPSVRFTVSDGTPPDDPTYAAALADPAKTYSNDALAALLDRNADAATASGQFASLGKALLTRFGADGDDVSLATTPSAAVDGLAPVHAGPDSDAMLSIRTTGGATVKVTLHHGDDGLSIAMKSDGPLSDDDRQAVSKLAGAFQGALDGLGASPPRLALDGLMGNDPRLASVDFNARVDDGQGKPQTIAFHAGSDARSLQVDGPSGTLSVGMDMTSAALWGNQAQRQASVANYLAQIDDAVQRGHGDASLIAMFKDAFGQMNSNYPPIPDASTAGPHVGQGDHAALTGLADFTASLSQAASAPNPLRSNELDTFSYDLSQQSRLGGLNDASRTIDQHQSSHLKASYHQALSPDATLRLTEDPKSQNYLYRLIDDSATSDTHIAYDKGKLAQASVTRTANQSTHDMKYVLNRLVEDATTPSTRSRTDDLRALIAPRLLGNGRSGFSPESLARAHADIALTSEPYLLGPASSTVSP
ncbi:hypothetical protein [Luteibacter sp. CQ10]|uniref:hypothetical protein n=1 Tax=Luteibacter sp. CQ10 TaxID=2805821 RepID=UPI0034A5988A